MFRCSLVTTVVTVISGTGNLFLLVCIFLDYIHGLVLFQTTAFQGMTLSPPSDETYTVGSFRPFEVHRQRLAGSKRSNGVIFT
jgi:hypothetical protein